MAEEIISLGCDLDDEIAFDEEILKFLREEWECVPEEYDNAFDDEIYALLNSSLDGLDDPALYDVCEDESLNVEELVDSDDDEWMLEGMEQNEQRGGNPLFSVTRERLGGTRQWQNYNYIKIECHRETSSGKRSRRHFLKAFGSICSNKA